MKKQLILCIVLIQLLSVFCTQAQRTILVLGKNNIPFGGARIIAGSEEFFTDQKGELAYKNSTSDFVRVIAAGYRSKKVDLRPYPENGMVAISLSPAEEILAPISVKVKDKNNKPVAGATITVTPGVSAVTNAGGYAKATHKQQPGEYVVVTVSKDGYADQQKRVLVGVEQADGPGLTVKDDHVEFVLLKGGNDRGVFSITVEVLDHETNEPVKGANVKLQLPDGASQTGTTDNKGEAKISDMEYGYQGTTAKVIVSHKDYEEKWSDITEDLMTAKDRAERQFVVFVSKKIPAGSLRLTGDPLIGKSRKDSYNKIVYTEYAYTPTTAILTMQNDPPDRKVISWTFSGVPSSLSPGQVFTVTITGKLEVNEGGDLQPPASAALRYKGLELISGEHAYISVKNKRDGKYVFKVPAKTTAATIETGADYGLGIFAIYNYKK